MNQILPNTSMSEPSRRAMAQRTIGTSIDRLAFASKLRMGNAAHHDPRRRGSMLVNANSQADMSKISQEQQIRIIDNQNASEIMPEIEWAARVLVSSILSPKDMTKRELSYAIKMGWLPPDIRQLICDLIKGDMEINYNYSDSMYHIVKDALFSRGSHPRLIMPEAAVDKIINSGHTLSLEDIRGSFTQSGTALKGGGFLGPMFSNAAQGLTMETFQRANSRDGEIIAESPLQFMGYDETGKHQSVKTLDLITITDSIDAIKLPAYMDAIMESRRNELLQRPGASFDDFDFGSPETTNESIIDNTRTGSFVDTSIRNENAHVLGASGNLFGKADQKAKVSGLSEDQFRAATYKAAPNNIVTHLRVPGAAALTRRSVGRPLVQSYPSEAVVPIHAPGDPRRHLGYLVIHDETGHPITLAGAEQTIARASALFNATNTTNSVGANNMGSLILSKAARNLAGTSHVTQLKELNKIFEQIIDENVITRMMNGAYPGGASIGDVGDLYSLMLARTLCSMRTRIVFMPADMISYFAFDYHDNGVGRSLLDRNKMLISLRSGLLLTRTTGEMRNAIPLTEVRMKIDPDDPDPEKTIDEALFLLSQTRQPQYPLTTLSVNDIMDWTHRAGFVLKFDDHPRLPDTGFEFEKKTHDNILPDPEFYDRLGKQLYMGFGIPPELMDTTYDPDFAVAVANRNIIFTQTILEYQKTLSGLMSDDVQRLTKSDGVLVQGIAEIVKSKWGAIVSNIPDEEKEFFKANPKNYALELVNRIVDTIVVSVPSPDVSTIENQSTQFEQYETFLDRALTYIVSEEIVSADYGAELIGKIATMRPAIKAAYMRDFMARNNILPELADVSSLTEEGKPAFDLLNMTETHVKGLIINLLSFAKKIIPLDVATAKDAKEMNLGDEGAQGATDLSGGGGMDGMGSFDMGAGFDETPMPSFEETTEIEDKPGDEGTNSGSGTSTADTQT